MAKNSTKKDPIKLKDLLSMARRGESWIPIVAPHFWKKEWLDTSRELVSFAPEHCRSLLKESMRFLPREWGQLIRSYDTDCRTLLILLQDNYFNWTARLNQAHILKAMTYTNCVKLVISSGASGIVDTRFVSSFPDRQVRLRRALLFLKSLELTAEEFCQIVDNTDFTIWGAEDEQLFRKQLDLHAKGEMPRMLMIHKYVPYIFLDNMLKKIREAGVQVAALTTCAFDLITVSNELERQGIPYYWIRGTPQGCDNVDEHGRLLAGERRPLKEIADKLSDEEVPEF